MRKYYTLIIRENGRWSPEFGDYRKAVVRDELEDQRTHHKRKDLMVITTEDVQASINAAIAELNGTCRHCDNPPLAGYSNCQACLEELGGDY